MAASGASGSPSMPPDTATALSEGWEQRATPTIPVDLDPDPNVLEIELEARVAEVELVAGTTTPAYTYGGSVPGPLLKAKVGDRLIVHFKNSLPDSTSIHWHGLRVPNDMDGVPGFTQDPVEPGGEFVYDFVLNDAGTFWYHPHIQSAAQVGWGMYGPLVVEDPSDPDLGEEIVVVLSDVSLDDAGQFVPADVGGEFGDLFGREGNVLLVNGQVMPRLHVQAGKRQRWRVINAARSRYYTVMLPNHTLTRLGGDAGFAERSSEVDSVVLVPGERADISFLPSSEPGATDVMQWIATDRGLGSTFNRPNVDMFEVATLPHARVEPAVVPHQLREIAPIDTEGAPVFAFDLGMWTDEDGNAVMGINGIPFQDAAPIHATMGETQIWRVTNETDFAHPWHLHGYFFQVLDDARIPEWKDTVDIPVGGEVRMAVHFGDRPGMWMYHCHILDHAEAGMMGHLHVMEEGAAAEP